jgi:hypothetical protein
LLRLQNFRRASKDYSYLHKFYHEQRPPPPLKLVENVWTDYWRPSLLAEFEKEDVALMLLGHQLEKEDPNSGLSSRKSTAKSSAST